jgi:hypothetical protein
MRSLAAAISPGDFGFTDWAFAAEAPSEIAVQVPIATRKNNALIIISSHIRSFSRMRSIGSAFQPAWSNQNQQRPHPLINRRLRACAAARNLLSVLGYRMRRGR